MAKRLRKKIQGYDMEDLPLLGVQYVQKKEAIKELTSQCNQIRVPLEEAVSKDGRVDDKGSKLLVLSHADVDVHLKHSRRVTISQTKDAIKILKENGLSMCVKEVVTEEIDELLLQEKLVDADLLAKLYESKVIYAFSVDVKEAFRE